MKQKISLILLSLLMLVLMFSSCGGVVEISVNFVVDGEAYHTISTTGEEAITMPQNPTKEGYVFDGWYWDNNTFQKPFTANSLLNQELSGDMSVYAKWTLEDITKKNYDLTFNSMGGSDVTSQSILYGNVANAPTNPAKTGYIFVGWYKEADFTTKWNFSADTVTENTTLYAKWVAENDAQGSVIIEAPSFEMNDRALSIEIPNAQEHLVISDLITVSPYATYKVTTDIEGQNEIPSGTVPVSVGDNTFYILVTSGTGSNKTQYTVNVHRRLMLNVVYDFNNGSQNITEVFEEDSKITTKEASKTGYTFVEWQYNGTAWNFENDVVTDNMTLEATYIANEYTVSFNSNGGSDVENATVIFDSEYTFEVPTRLGYAFDGWRNAKGDLLTDSQGNGKTAWTIADNTALFAQWTPIGYEITYHNVDGATNNNMPTYDVEDEPLELLDASKTGYTFLGWYTDADFENAITEIAVGTTGAFDIYAKWEAIEYTATFMDGTTEVDKITFTVETESIQNPEVPNHNGYTGVWESYILGASDITVNAVYTPITYTITYEGTKGVTNTNPTTYTIESATITLSDISATGYTFNGWYNGSNKVTEIATGSIGNITLTANWTPITYTITYEGTKGASNSNPATYTIESDTITLKDISVTGYTFNGWYNGNDKVTEIATGSTGNITLTANWTPITYTITYEGTKGATNTNPTTYTIESATITLSDISVTGYTFNGWYNGDDAVTEIAQGSTGNITLTANWTAIKYNITYMYDSGIGDYADTNKNPATYTIEDDFDFISLVNKTTGYTFDGWYTQKNVGTGTRVTGVEAGSTGDITIYAHWALDEYTITYHNANGVTNTNATTYTVETDTFEIFDISKEGYTFNGWYSDSTFSTKVTEIAKGTTGNKDLYAKWTPIEYTIEYVLYGGTYEGESNPESYTIEDAITFNAPTLNGYTFVGFFTLAEGGERVTEIAKGTVGNKTLYARYIAFDTNGGSAVEYEFSVSGNKISKPTEPQMEYYTFKGWYEDEALTEEFDFSIPTKTLTLYAKFEPTVYKITYVLNGGTNPQNQVLEYTVEDTTVALLNPTKTGYTFVGWFTDDKFTSSVVTELKNEHGDKTFYANYSINQYTISFETNGGTEVEAITQNYATSVVAPSAPAKNGYKFEGWYSDSTLKNKYTFTTMPANDVTLYAKWTLETYNITYNLVGGTNNKNNPSTFNIQSADITLQAPTKTGYNFVGWYTDNEYENAITKIVNGTYGNIELYAKWEIITYTITYVTDDGTENTNATTYTVETDLSYLADATLKGHTFGGWYSDSSYSTRVYQIGGGEIGNITLYAKFTANTYDVYLDGTEEASVKVSFDLNGASGSVATQTITESNTLTYPTAPTREGYMFGGWYSNKECTGNLYDFTALITSDITLYAKWVKADSSIAVNSNVTVTLNGREEQKYTFVPLVSGNVTFTTTGDYDTLGILYDANGNVLKMDDDTGSDGINFQIVFNVTAGEVYTIAVRSYSSATSGTSTLYVSGNDTVSAGGYVITGNKTQITYGSDFTIDLPSAREGYKFLGWADKNGTMYTDGTGASVKAWDKDETTLLVSVWERTVYTITFVTGSGTAIDPVSLAYGERLDISKYVSTRSGYKLDFWILDGEEFNATTMPDHNITLTAKWTKLTLSQIKKDETKTAISVNDEITAELFGVECYDSNGNKANIAITVNGTQSAGETITITFVASADGITTKYQLNWTVQVYGAPTLEFDNTVDYVNLVGGMTAEHFSAVGTDTFGNTTEIKVYIEGDYKAGDIVTVTIEAVDIAGNVTKGYAQNVKAYGLPEITYNEEKTAISVNDTLSADLFGASAKDSFGNDLEIVNEEIIKVKAEYQETLVAVKTIVADRTTYTIRYKNESSTGKTILSVADSSGNFVLRCTEITNYLDYATAEFEAEIGEEYRIFVASYAVEYNTNFTFIIENDISIEAGNTVTIPFSATDSKGNVTTIYIDCKVYGTPTISSALKTDVKVTDTITPDLLGITGKDTFGNSLDVTLTVKEGTQEAGTTMVITATVTDIAGNVATKDFTLKVYGTPTISYDIEAIKVSENPETDITALNATAKDSFGKSLLVTAKLKSGYTFEAGKNVVYTLTATDHLGNSYSVDTAPIGVYDIADIEESFTYSPYDSDFVKIETTGEEFSASATDSFGNACVITVESADGSTLVGGTNVAIVLVATDKAGNRVVSDTIDNFGDGIAIYAMPTVEIDEWLTEDTVVSLMATVYDSFGTQLYAEITLEGEQVDGNKVYVTVKATDDAGNELNVTYTYVVNHTAHEASDWIVDKEASCTEEGSRHKECICEKITETEIIAKLAHTYENGYCSVCGAEQPYTRVDDDTILFGSYPQTEVTDSTLKSTLNSLAGTKPTSSNAQAWTSYGYYISGSTSNFMWYIDIEEGGEKYRGVYFTSYRPDYCDHSSSTGNTYQDDNGYTTSNIYWFKYEPISWTILNENNGTALILCDMIIDSQAYQNECEYNSSTGYFYIKGRDTYANNYEYSTIRAWLNDNFYNTAFDELQKEIILTTTVDNSVASTGYSSNQYACEDTEDKVFLLSYKELTTYLTTNASRMKKTTDYAQAQGAYIYTSSSYLGYGYWWLRSPRNNYSEYARDVIAHGDFSCGIVDNTSFGGVVPALQIQL